MFAMSFTASALSRARLPIFSLRTATYLQLDHIAPKPWLDAGIAKFPARSFAAAAVVREQSGVHDTPTVTALSPHDNQQHPFYLQSEPKLQPFDFTALAACVAELQRQWVPARVEEAVQYTHSAVALRLRTMEHTLWLYLSWHPTLAHIGVSQEGPPKGSVAQEFSFGEQMHSALKGLVLTGVTVPQPWERTLALEFSTRPGDEPSITVFVEIVGRYSNVVLTEAKGKTVVAAGHQVGTKMSSLRAVYVGKPYTLPPAPQGVPPTACGTLEEWKAALLLQAANANEGSSSSSAHSPTILSKCVQRFHGVSPSLVREMCESAGVAPDADPAALESPAWEALYTEWTTWLEKMDSGRFSAAWSPTGAFSLLGGHIYTVDSPLEFLRTYYGWFESGEEFEKTKHRVTRGVSQAVVRMAKKITSLKQQAADPSVHEATSHKADLIMANLHAIKAGSSNITVEDWDTGEPITIALDSTKTPIACAEELYKKARKQRRAVDQVAPLIEEAQQQLEYLQDAECMLQQLGGRDSSDLAALRESEAELVAGGFMKASSEAALLEKAVGKARKSARKGAKRQKGSNGSGGADGSGEGFRRYVSPNGFVVLVGRNSTQNDQLTMRMAQNTDVWMHARGVPGAHVLLRIPAGRKAETPDLQFAADLAAFFSKSRSEGKLQVTMANPAHISKPRGAKPGQVLVKQEKVILGKPAQSAANLAGEA